MPKYVSDLSVKGLNNLIANLNTYRDSLTRKSELLTKRLTDIGYQVIEENIAKASFTVDAKGVVSGADTTHITSVRFNVFGSATIATLTCQGEDLLFIEFGAGVHYNGPVGQSPNPMGVEKGYTIGSYGLGNGAKDEWGYYEDNGDLVITHGTKATMPMYRASLAMIISAVQVAREVFASG